MILGICDYSSKKIKNEKMILKISDSALFCLIKNFINKIQQEPYLKPLCIMLLSELNNSQFCGLLWLIL